MTRGCWLHTSAHGYSIHISVSSVRGSARSSVADLYFHASLAAIVQQPSSPGYFRPLSGILFFHRTVPTTINIGHQHQAPGTGPVVERCPSSSAVAGASDLDPTTREQFLYLVIVIHLPSSGWLVAASAPPAHLLTSPSPAWARVGVSSGDPPDSGQLHGRGESAAGYLRTRDT